MQERPDGQRLLSGSAAASFNDAHAVAARRRGSAASTALRLERLLAEYQKAPHLTKQRLYWDTVIETLSERPLTIVDPRAAGRQHLWLGDPISMPLGPTFPLAAPAASSNDGRATAQPEP